MWCGRETTMTNRVCITVLLWSISDLWGSQAFVPAGSLGSSAFAQLGQWHRGSSQNGKSILNRGRLSIACGRQRRMGWLPMVAMDQEGDGAVRRDEAMQEKLRKWREQAETVRLQDPSSFVSRAAATNVPRFGGRNATGSRTDALRRMWNLKEIERRADIAEEIETLRQTEDPSLAAAREKSKAAAQAHLDEFVSTLPPSKSIEELEAAAMELRSLPAINEKLAKWREESRAAQEADVARSMLVALFAALNQVAKIIGWITGTRAELSDLEPIRFRPAGARKPAVAPTPPEKNMDELLQRLRSRWQNAEQQRAPSVQASYNRLTELIAGDDGAEIKALLNSLLDFPDVYGALLGFSQDSPLTPPLQLAAASGRAQAVEVLLRAGSAAGEAEEEARRNGHAQLAAYIAQVQQERSASP